MHAYDTLHAAARAYYALDEIELAAHAAECDELARIELSALARLAQDRHSDDT